MKEFGLIGKKLSHSFSKNYFTNKFEELGLHNHTYHLFELACIDEVVELKARENLVGFNVTVPYKQEIGPYLTELDRSAIKVGAVNVVKIKGKSWKGYNSDYYGFLQSLKNWLPYNFNSEAVILGSGGASKAVESALVDLKIAFKTVSRNPLDHQINYKQANELIAQKAHLIINTTPLGMSPKTEGLPPISYDFIDERHFLYDLVYNPEMTRFLKEGKSRTARVKNGLEMLHLQAEESWRIWNKE